VPQGGEVRHHANVPEEERYGEVSGDREHVPEERTAEVLPDAVGVRDREEIPGEPDAPDVEGRENARATDGEDGHRLRRAVDGGPPLLPREIENGRDERTRVTDAD